MTNEDLFSSDTIYKCSRINISAKHRRLTAYLLLWGFMLLLVVGATGCGASQSTPPPTEPSSLLPARLAEAIPPTPQDAEQTVKTLGQVFKKWALAGNLQDSPDVLAAFSNLLVLSDLDPAETMQSWLAEAQAQASGEEATDFAALQAALTGDFETLSLEESFFILWQHSQENPDPAADAGVRLALIVAVGDENLQREMVRAWGQLTE